MRKLAVAAKIDPELASIIQDRARERGVTVSSLVAEALGSFFRQEEGNREISQPKVSESSPKRDRRK
ncbi:MAG: hypothetical protein QXU73_08000 [Thermoplasmata archaeon]